MIACSRSAFLAGFSSTFSISDVFRSATVARASARAAARSECVRTGPDLYECFRRLRPPSHRTAPRPPAHCEEALGSQVLVRELQPFQSDSSRVTAVDAQKTDRRRQRRLRLPRRRLLKSGQRFERARAPIFPSAERPHHPAAVRRAWRSPRAASRGTAPCNHRAASMTALRKKSSPRADSRRSAWPARARSRRQKPQPAPQPHAPAMDARIGPAPCRARRGTGVVSAGVDCAQKTVRERRADESFRGLVSDSAHSVLGARIVESG